MSLKCHFKCLQKEAGGGRECSQRTAKRKQTMQAEAEVDAHICARWVISQRQTAHNDCSAPLPTVHPTVPILTSLLSVVPARVNFCRFAHNAVTV